MNIKKPEDKPMTVGERLRKYRKNILGISQAEVANRVKQLTGDEKCSQQTIGDIETGKTLNSSFLPAIAAVLNISLDYLNPDLKRELTIAQANDIGSSPVNTPITTNLPQDTTSKKQTLYLEQEVPIFETIDLVEDGFIITDTPIDFIPRPHVVKLEKECFGITVRCRSLEPAIRIGNTIIIHPRKLPNEGNFCLFFNETHNVYTIGEFVKEDKNYWCFKKYTPNKEMYLEKELWKKCYVIVAIFL